MDDRGKRSARWRKDREKRKEGEGKESMGGMKEREKKEWREGGMQTPTAAISGRLWV